MSEATEAERIARPRGVKACSSCRSRKIRCDVIRTGPPCTRCQADKFDCVIQPRKKRGRKSPLDVRDGVQIALPEHVVRHQIPHYAFFRSFVPPGNPWLRSQDASGGVMLPVYPRDDSAEKVWTEDLRYLTSLGAMDLPSRDILDECITAYFHIFHPFFPVVDRPSFMRHYRRAQENTNGNNADDVEYSVRHAGVSLLLLQAIIFTSIAFIETSSIQAMGFLSKQQARSAYHAKARHLHNFAYEPDDITTIQALLLLSQYYPSMAEQRHTWFWAHQAIGLAQGLGLHRQTQGPQRKLWTRIWWACLIRDRLIALGTNRPMHINSLDCNVSLPTADDLSEDGDVEDDTAIKAIFADLAKLCYYMEGILTLPLSAPASLSDQMSICESTLNAWLANLSVASQRDIPVHSNLLLLYRSLLHLTYNVARIALQQSGQKLQEISSFRMPSKTVQEISSDSIRIIADLMRHDLASHCPTQIVTTVIPPLITQLLLIRLTGPPANLNALSEFNTCMAFLKQLGSLYWHAGFYHDYFELAASRSGSAARYDTEETKGTENPEDNPNPVPSSDQWREREEMDLNTSFPYMNFDIDKALFGVLDETVYDQGADENESLPEGLSNGLILYQSLFPSA